MTPSDLAEERRKQRALERLGTDSPRCVECDEDDWRCLELHHPGGQAYDDTTVILCRNCHRKVSDPGDNERAPLDPPLLERAGRLILGLVTLLLALLPRLREVGQQLLEAAQQCARPYGWVSAS
jgi:hypothetical protein